MHRSILLTFAGLTAWLALMVVVIPVSHDEDQYVAAAALVARGLRPYLDFAYLQTPLQPWLFGPLVAHAPAGFAFPALRSVNALCGLITLIAIYGAQYRLGVARAPALIATVFCAATMAFTFGATVARNDALPTMLLALALWVAVARGARARAHAVAGLLLGLAVSTKISFLAPLGGWGLWLVWRGWPNSLAPPAACVRRGRAGRLVSDAVGVVGRPGWVQLRRLRLCSAFDAGMVPPVWPRRPADAGAQG